MANALVPIQAERNGIRIEGYLGKPEQVRSNRNFEIYFINGRFIRSSVVSRAIEEGYREYLMQHKFPLCVLHITMDTERVDVNVHPTKMDVRFSDVMPFSDFLIEAVHDTLKNREMIPEASLSTQRELQAEKKALQAAAMPGGKLAGASQRKQYRTPEPFEQRRARQYQVAEEAKYHTEKPVRQDFTQNPVWNRVKPAAQASAGEIPRQNEAPQQCEVAAQDEALQQGKTAAQDEPEVLQQGKTAAQDEPKVLQQGKTTAQNEALQQETKTAEDDFFTETSEFAEAAGGTRSIEAAPALEEGASPGEKVAVQMNLFEEKLLTMDNRSRFRIIGQVFGTFWLVEFEDKLLMIDQHAAHEKVNYERLMRQFHAKSVVSQSLLPPVIVSLSGQEENVLREHREVFLRLGFEVEPFGGSEYALRSVPADLYGCNEREMFLAVLDQLAEGVSFGGIRVIEEKIASMSCKAAVKGNSSLSAAEAESLIDELLTLENPYNCPHGRPTIVTMTRAEMDRKFKRIVG